MHFFSCVQSQFQSQFGRAGSPHQMMYSGAILPQEEEVEEEEEELGIAETYADYMPAKCK